MSDPVSGTPADPASLSYADAGVDLEAADRSVELLSGVLERATRPEVLGGIGGFGGLFALDASRYEQPVLVSSTDGVGTKVDLARRLGILDTVGRDLVAMVVDDLVVTGAEPLFFNDYVSVGKLDPERVADLVRGIAEGCAEAGCALVGGETAEHPGLLADDEFDLAGFGVGVVEQAAILGPQHVQAGDVLVAMASSGPHSNGYSLIRRIVDGLDLADPHGLDRPLGAALLEPTRIYALDCLALIEEVEVHAMCHVTGGGLPGNLPRVLPDTLDADVDVDSWERPPSSAGSRSVGRSPTTRCGAPSTVAWGWSPSSRRGRPTVPSRCWSVAGCRRGGSARSCRTIPDTLGCGSPAPAMRAPAMRAVPTAPGAEPVTDSSSPPRQDAPTSPIEVALGELERRRRDRWIVGAVLVLAVVAALGVLLVDEAAVPTGPWAAAGFLVVALLYGASVVVQERRAQRTVRALVEEREHLAALEARVAALETLHEVVREVVAAQTLPDVFDRLLRGATKLTGASGGAVLLRVGDTLTVAASDGAGAAELGTEVVEDEGAAWGAVRSGTTTIVARGAEWGMVAGASTLAAPLRLVDHDEGAGDGRIVGALVVERSADAPAFTAADRLATSLFAQQAALAVRNASRLDRADEQAAALAAERRELSQAIERHLDDLRGTTAAVTGTVQLLRHRGHEFPAARRHALLDDLLERTAGQRELLARLEGLTRGADEPPTP
jgi:phosphoribosylformylglycinamidine cyclo-ligase